MGLGSPSFDERAGARIEGLLCQRALLLFPRRACRLEALLLIRGGGLLAPDLLVAGLHLRIEVFWPEGLGAGDLRLAGGSHARHLEAGHRALERHRLDLTL